MKIPKIIPDVIMKLTNGFLFKSLFENLLNGCAHCHCVYDDDGNLVDWTYVLVNKAYTTVTGIPDPTGKKLSEILPDFIYTNSGSVKIYERVSKGAVSERFEQYVPSLERWLAVSAYSVEIGTFTVVFDDITERKKFDVALKEANEQILKAFVMSLESRDRLTEDHTIRVTELAIKFAQMLGIFGEDLMNVRRGALLHDIGKIGIPDYILFKEGRLTAEEYEVMKQHSQKAYDVLHPIKYLRPAIDIPYCHHEKWDGTGYPRGLVGEEIPLFARLFSIVDVYDALMSARPYRKAMPQDIVISFLKTEAGAAFDPSLVSIFIEMVEAQDE